jgi:subtilisin family serine protease
MKYFCLLGTTGKVTMQLIASLLVAILLTENFAYAQVPGGGKGKASLQLLEKMDAGTSQDFIVVYDDSATKKEAQSLELEMGLASHHNSIVELKAARYAEKKQEIQSAFGSHETTVLKDYSHLPLSFVRFHSREALDKLLAHPGVAGVYENTVKRLALAESLPLIGQPQVAAQGNMGAGTSVAVLDTGVSYTRSAFGSCTSPGVPANCKVVYAQDFDPGDAGTHGTNVAGIVAKVAPGTKIVDLKVFGASPTLDTVIIEAMNWVIANKTTYNLVAMNLSLGSEPQTSPVTNGFYNVVVNQARAAGILTVAAAGNDGYTNALLQPAATSGVVSVGAVYDSQMGQMKWARPSNCSDATTAADKVTCFSNSASFLTLLAPGTWISAAGERMSVTSQAAPHVAGAVAVLRAAFPSETLDQTVARLTNGVMVTDSKNGITKPRLNLQMAIGVATSCAYAISETSKSFGSNSSTGSIAVTTGAACTWSTASSTSSANWLTVTSGNSGSGNGTVTYALSENSNTSSRTGTLTVAGKTYTVTQSGSVGAVANTLLNSGFESGPVSWTEQTANGYPVITAFLNPTTTDGWYAWLCGYNDCLDNLYQDVTIPADAQGAVLSFKYWINTAETTSATVYDVMSARIYSPPNASTYATCSNQSLSNLNATTGWVPSAGCNLGGYKGQTIRIKFVATTDSELPTDFFVDDVTLVVTRTSAPATSANVIEFYNTNLDNYFITANSSEAAAIDGGSAGPGWSRTGNTFKSGGSTPVCRFYGSQSPGPNSHFYTVDSAECQGLKDQQIPMGDPRKLTIKSWNFESLDFVSTPPTNGSCLSGTVPVYRAYNNGFARGVDSNHRITSSTTAIQDVVSRGWSNEGVVMCAPQ